MTVKLAQYFEKPSLEESQGPVTEEDAAFLYGLALLIRPRCIVEIGLGWNRSLRAFCDAAKWMKDNLVWDCQVWSCDVDQEALDRAKSICPDAHLVLGPAARVAVLAPPAELVFIDAEHTHDAVLSDYAATKSASDAGCIFVFHDHRVNAGILEAVKELGATILPGPRGMAILGET